MIVSTNKQTNKREIIWPTGGVLVASFPLPIVSKSKRKKKIKGW